MTQSRLWTRDFIIVSGLNFLQILVFYLLVVVIGLYATRDLNASVSQAGLVVGVFIVGVLAGRLLIGQYIDKLGRKRSMLVGQLLATTACLLYYAQTDIGFLIAIRFIHGIGVGIAATAIATVVAQLIPVSRKGEGIGYFSMSASLATAIGPFIGIMMIQQVGFGMILGLCSVLSMSCFLVGLVLHVPEINHPESESPAQPLVYEGFSFTRLVEPRVVPICSIVLLNSLSYSGVLSFVNAFAGERNLSQPASLFFLVYAVTLLASRPFSGRLLDRRGANVIMYPGFVLLALGLLLLGWSNSGLQLLSSACLIGLGFGNMQSCVQAMVVKMAAPARLGLATSTYFIFLDAGLGFGPYLLGLIVPYLGYGDMYLLLAVLSLCTIGGYYLVHGRNEGRGPAV